MQAAYFTYILKCADGTLYTGWTVDLAKRIVAHNAGLGAKYTRSRVPVELVCSFRFETKVEAMKMEFAIKKLSRTKKMALLRESSGLEEGCQLGPDS